MDANDLTLGRARRVTGNILIALPSLAMAGSSAAKLAGVPSVVHELNAHGLFAGAIVFVAFLELVSAATFLIPATRDVGLLLLSAFFGGAMAKHLEHNELMFAPAMLLALAWTGVLLRHPSAFWTHRFGAR